MRCTLTDAEGSIVLGEQPPDRAAIRTAPSSKLPWSMHVFSAPPVTVALSPQRQLLLWVLGVLGMVWTVSAYFIMRAISREIRVARLQSDFVAAVSHEFRSPLSSLRQISEMLAEDRLPSDNARRESYGVLARESERLHQLVEDLLDFGRFDAGREIYHFEPLELRGFLQVLVADFQQRVSASGYRVALNLPDFAVHVRADAAALSRAIWNLLDNAVKYSPNSHTVWVDVELNETQVSLSVRDEGLGIPAREQREIFEQFVRGSESKTLRIKGTGIGLAMVRHIMQAHGGEILLRSEPGKGSRFTMVLDKFGAVS
jgi:signal transduction histidine kinase